MTQDVLRQVAVRKKVIAILGAAFGVPVESMTPSERIKFAALAGKIAGLKHYHGEDIMKMMMSEMDKNIDAMSEVSISYYYDVAEDIARVLNDGCYKKSWWHQ